MEDILSPFHLQELRSSGLSDKTISECKFKSINAKEAKAATGMNCGPGWLCPYYARGQFQSWITFKPDTPFLGRAKYLQPIGQSNHVYFPPIIDTHKLQDIHTPIFITEGVKKACAAAQKGLLCISISGVNNWIGADGEPIPELFDLQLKGRQVFIAFDSDINHNIHVRKAAAGLAKTLLIRKAVVSILCIDPAQDGGKLALDDIFTDCVNYEDAIAIIMGTPRFLMESVNDCKSFPHSAGPDIENGISKLNNEIVGIKDEPQFFLELSTGKKYPYAYSQGTPYGGNNYQVKSHNAPIPAFPLWKASKDRKFITSFICNASHTPLSYSDGEYNLWSGWPFKPKPPTPETRAENAFGMPACLWEIFRTMGNWNQDYPLSKTEKDTEAEELRLSVIYQIEYFALILQNAGQKTSFASILLSETQGVGKSLMGEIIGELFSKKHSMQLIDDDIFSDYTLFGEDTLFICINELTISGKLGKSNANKLKGLITSDEMTYNQKFGKKGLGIFRANFLLTSNEIDCAFDQRRFLVHQYPQNTKPLSPYIAKSCRENMDNILWFFLNYKIKYLSLKSPPPQTEGARILKDVFSNPTETWLRDFLETKIPANQQFTVQQVINAYMEEGYSTNSIIIGRLLGKMGMRSLVISTNNNKFRIYRNTYRDILEKKIINDERDINESDINESESHYMFANP